MGGGDFSLAKRRAKSKITTPQKSWCVFFGETQVADWTALSGASSSTNCIPGIARIHALRLYFPRRCHARFQSHFMRIVYATRERIST